MGRWLEYAGHAGQVVRDELDAQSDAGLIMKETMLSCAAFWCSPWATPCVHKASRLLSTRPNRQRARPLLHASITKCADGAHF
eukprot:scaffold85889_cov39-Tisochrysis_lutea.AAC.2